MKIVKLCNIKQKVQAIHVHHNNHDHPDHTGQLKQLARVKGQVEGVENMIKDGRYCVDIINQIKAISAGLKVVEIAIFDAHLNSCVQAVLNSKNAITIKVKIDEITKLVHGSKSK